MVREPSHVGGRGHDIGRDEISGAEDWRKGATLSDKTARSQYGLTQEGIYAAIDAGKL